MNLQWSDEALADLDRFVEFLSREHPSLAAIIANEIIDKVKVLSSRPQLGRPIAGREEYRQIVLQVLGAAYVFRISIRWQASCDVAGVSCARSARVKSRMPSCMPFECIETLSAKKKPALPPAFVSRSA